MATPKALVVLVASFSTIFYRYIEIPCFYKTAFGSTSFLSRHGHLKYLKSVFKMTVVCHIENNCIYANPKTLPLTSLLPPTILQVKTNKNQAHQKNMLFGYNKEFCRLSSWIGAIKISM